MQQGNKHVYNKCMEYYLITYNSNIEVSFEILLL